LKVLLELRDDGRWAMWTDGEFLVVMTNRELERRVTFNGLVSTLARLQAILQTSDSEVLRERAKGSGE
jgi:hypothetical protein